ncbi:ice-structuring glycoprotein-like [Scaptodrosophila lebanonensis]|uniref:Ice-structuring glycoprotein-like n=1 Tax=Drosophila lebanonensis TaxID=7225 RepID=A0A6J2U1U7_DROLE|nr:ice-structuring glycoprotein-like [Scaptodrosophila lebanonensis]
MVRTRSNSRCSNNNNSCNDVEMADDHLHERDNNRGGGKATRERSKTRKSGVRGLNTASPADCEAEDVSPTKKRIKEKAGVAASSSSSPDLDDGATAAVARSTASLAADIAAGTNAEGVSAKPATDAAAATAAAAKLATIADAAVAKPTMEAVFKKPLAPTTVASTSDASDVSMTGGSARRGRSRQKAASTPDLYGDVEVTSAKKRVKEKASIIAAPSVSLAMASGATSSQCAVPVVAETENDVATTSSAVAAAAAAAIAANVEKPSYAASAAVARALPALSAANVALPPPTVATYAGTAASAATSAVPAVPRCSVESIVAGGSSAIQAELSRIKRQVRNAVMRARMEPDAAIDVMDAAAKYDDLVMSLMIRVALLEEKTRSNIMPPPAAPTYAAQVAQTHGAIETIMSVRSRSGSTSDASDVSMTGGSARRGRSRQKAASTPDLYGDVEVTSAKKRVKEKASIIAAPFVSLAMASGATSSQCAVPVAVAVPVVAETENDVATTSSAVAAAAAAAIAANVEKPSYAASAAVARALPALSAANVALPPPTVATYAGTAASAATSAVPAVPRCSVESIVAGGSSAIQAELSRIKRQVRNAVMRARMEPDAAIDVMDAAAKYDDLVMSLMIRFALLEEKTRSNIMPPPAAPTYAAQVAQTHATQVVPTPLPRLDTAARAATSAVPAVPRCSVESIVAGGSSAIQAELSGIKRQVRNAVARARMEPDASIDVLDAAAMMPYDDLVLSLMLRVALLEERTRSTIMPPPAAPANAAHVAQTYATQVVPTPLPRLTKKPVETYSAIVASRDPSVSPKEIVEKMKRMCIAAAQLEKPEEVT